MNTSYTLDVTTTLEYRYTVDAPDPETAFRAVAENIATNHATWSYRAIKLKAIINNDTGETNRYDEGS